MSASVPYHPNTLEYHAAVLEAEQAHRDFVDAYQAYMRNPLMGSAQDYLMVHAAGYAQRAEELARALPVWSTT